METIKINNVNEINIARKCGLTVIEEKDGKPWYWLHKQYKKLSVLEKDIKNKKIIGFREVDHRYRIQREFILCN